MREISRMLGEIIWRIVIISGVIFSTSTSSEDAIRSDTMGLSLDICEEVFTEETRNGTCVPISKLECNHGTYTGKGCILIDSWGGNFCNKSLLCLSILQQYVSNNTISNIPKNLLESNVTEIATEEPQINQEAPECCPECIYRFGSTAPVNMTRNNSKIICHFIRIDSPCNIASADFDFAYKYGSVIGAILEILLFAMIVYAAYLKSRKQRMKNRMISESVQFLYANDGTN